MLITRRKFILATAALCSAASIAHAQDNKVLRVATDATFPPMEFVQNGHRTGFDIDLVEAMAKQMGRHVQWTDIDFKGLIPGLVAHRFDVAVSAIYITDARKKVVDFTQPYYHGGLVVLVKKSNTAIKTPADLDGKKVSVQVGTKSVDFLRTHYPKVQRVEVEKNEDMFNLVQIGRVDAAVTGKPAAQQYAKTTGDMRVLDTPLTTEEYGMAVRKDMPQLTQQLNAALDKIKANGTYAKLLKKWFGPDAK
ncbi:ABC transporter permease [Pandoraea thiooxydans]|uniref:Glutamine ABC transporter substrate-binding protein n=1 Tax=Pandoraea thiooxydans TaxID=445709 RepID=A0A0G3ERT9_9BURK|nr:glutamine ABC transporter substrate-binding protein [Pandoraea thiooxydans]AKJ68749.1 glutamine ABC transporter substrate-binding protein [Pandoraea thiooxydans]APR96196.1 ABC transporter permease [Pandoraea thiooxydans]